MFALDNVFDQNLVMYLNSAISARPTNFLLS